MSLSAPFPYFGGKSKVAGRVWAALGNPKTYIEPFFGSGAVLLSRGRPPAGCNEIINDADCFIANVWRALCFSPDEVARWCDWPVNHMDLMARREELLRRREELSGLLLADARAHDPVLAGYWIWAASCWIGAGLTHKTARPKVLNPAGCHKKIPELAHGGGVQTVTDIRSWFRALQERLRHVRVICGDWSRVCGGNWQALSGDCGIFFDPPYAVGGRAEVYDHDSKSVAHEVRRWALERGSRPEYRIVIAGYGEHDELGAHGWRKETWKANGGYSNRVNGRGKRNSLLECLWFSPYCLDREPELF